MTLRPPQRFGMQRRGRIDLFRRVGGGGHGWFPLLRHSGAREARTRNLEIPGLVLRTIPEMTGILLLVMAGLVPAIHVFCYQVVDARHRRQVYAVCARQTAK